MKWPFVRTSFHDNIVSQLINREIRLDEEINRLNNVIANMEALKNEYAQLNHDNLNEINRLNQELASELNSHKSTKKYNLTINKELEETKDALKIAQEETRQHRMTIDFADEKEEKIKQYLIKVINYI